MSRVQLALIGMGKMGQAVDALAPDSGFEVVARLDGENAEVTRRTLGGADVAIEFTEPASAPANIRACAAAGCPVVVGTTGWYDQLDAVSGDVRSAGGALLYAPNFSVGVQLFAALARQAGESFGAAGGFEVRIVETHHAAKKDAPSGTAKLLADALEGGMGTRPGITSVRTGSVPGTHEIVFDGGFEEVRLIHEARDRKVFAAGALRAARWLLGREGVFTMQDVIAEGQRNA